MKKQLRFILTLALVFATCVNFVQSQSGGTYTIQQSVIAGGGGQQSTGGTYSLDGTIGQAVAGGVIENSPYAATSGFWNFTPSSLTAATYEGDVSPRGSGDSAVSSTDVSVIQGFQLGLGLPYQSNEFQRADCAPFGSRGDGQVSSIDVSQAQAYQLGLNLLATNALQPAAGPTASGGGNALEFDSLLENSKTANRTRQSVQAPPRVVRVVNSSANRGGTATVLINVDAVGDESVYGFSLLYDSNVLSNPVISRGTAQRVAVRSRIVAGTSRIGFSVTFTPPDGSDVAVIEAGDNQNLVRIQFTVANNAAAGDTPITFTDDPTIRQVASDPNDPRGVIALETTFETGGRVTVLGTTAATTSVSGRVLTPEGRGIRNVVVSMRDSNGVLRTATTTSFGYYRFEGVETGETYVITASGKRFSFTQPSQVLNVRDDTTEVNFIGTLAPSLRDLQ